MRLLEIITVRLCDPLPQALIGEIENALSGCDENNHVSKIGILVDVETGCDLSVHIPTDSSEKSAAGIELASHLSTKGIVNHTVWRKRS